MKKQDNMFLYSLVIASFMLLWLIMVPIWDLKEWAIKSWMVSIWIVFDMCILALLATQSMLIYKKSKYVRPISRLCFVLLFFEICLNLIVFFVGNLVTPISVGGLAVALFTLACAAGLFVFYLNLEKETYSA